VRGPKRVVDVGVGQLGQPGGQLGIVLGLPRLKADVLQQQHIAAVQPSGELPGPVADRFGRELHHIPDQLGQTRRHGLQREVGVVALGASQVRDQHQRRAALSQLLDRGQGGPDAGIVGDRSVVKRDVEVHSHKDPLAVELA
jgi:hypothetical protein